MLHRFLVLRQILQLKKPLRSSKLSAACGIRLLSTMESAEMHKKPWLLHFPFAANEKHSVSIKKDSIQKDNTQKDV